MSGPGKAYHTKEDMRRGEKLGTVYSDAAQLAAAAREAGRGAFVYHSGWVTLPTSKGAGAVLAEAIVPGEYDAVAAMIDGVESQGWRLEHVVWSERFTMFFRREG